MLYLQLSTEVARKICREKQNIAKTLVKWINGESWSHFIDSIEYDIRT